MSKTSSTLPFVNRPQAADNLDPCWVPNTDVYIAGEGLVIKVELAGMRKEDLQLVIEGNKVKISGHRPDGCRAPKCRFQIMEINYGDFQTTVEIQPGYDLSGARAAYQNGFLRIDIPRMGAVSRVEIDSD